MVMVTIPVIIPLLVQIIGGTNQVEEQHIDKR